MSSSIRIHISGDLNCFKGHFPGQPILPAYAILDMSLNCVKTSHQNIKLFKMKDSVRPGEVISIYFSSSSDETEIIWKKTLTEKVVAEIILN